MNRKRSLSSNLSRKELDDDEFVAGIHEMHGVADRAAAVIGGALVEDALVNAISERLDFPEPKGPLFHEQGAPFGTFSNRIVAAKAMGYLSLRQAADLVVIKDLRNQFAHALLPLRFSNDFITAECAKIDDYQYSDMPKREGVDPARVRYEMACCGIWILISRQVKNCLQEKNEKKAMDLAILEHIAARREGGP